MVMAMVSVSGVGSQLSMGRSLPLTITALFVAGGVVGLFAGQRLGRKLNGAALQKIFAAAILLVAALMIGRNLFHSHQDREASPPKPNASQRP